MSGQISFTQIPASTRVPLFHVEFDPSQAGIARAVPRTLIIGITLVVQPVAPIFIPSLAWAQNAFGAGSQLFQMIKAYRANDPIGELWALPVFAPSGGEFAAGAFAFSGTATAAGTLAAYIAGRPVYVSVASGTTAAQLATALNTAIGALPLPYELPVTSAVDTATVTLTANGKGLWGNGIDLRLNYAGAAAGESTPPGITPSVTAMSGGTLDPDLSGVAAAMGSQPFDYVVSPFLASGSTTAMSAIMGNAAGRWSDAGQLYGHVFGANVDTVGNLVTFGGTLNDPHLTMLGMYKTPTPNYIVAAAAVGAAVQAINNDPARPLHTLPVAGVLAPAIADRMTRSQRESLLTHGVATLAVSQTGEVSIERFITTWQTDGFGNPSTAYLNASTLFTLAAVTRDLRAFVSTQFARVKIADNGTPAGPGSAIVTPNLIKASLVGRYKALVDLGWVERADLFAKGLVVQRNSFDPTRVDVLYDPYLMSGLEIFAVLNQFRLGGGR